MHPKARLCLSAKGCARKRPPAVIANCSDAFAPHRHHGITGYSAMAGDDPATNAPKNIPYVKRCPPCGGKMYHYAPFDKALNKKCRRRIRSLSHDHSSYPLPINLLRFVGLFYSANCMLRHPALQTFFLM